MNVNGAAAIAKPRFLTLGSGPELQKSSIVTDADVMAGLSERVPGDVQPGGGSQELVGVLPLPEELHERLELRRVLWTDVGSLADEVLGIADTAHLAIHGLTTETRVDDDRPHHEPRRLQQLMTAISQICHDLHRGDVLGVFVQIQELAQLKMRR